MQLQRSFRTFCGALGAFLLVGEAGAGDYARRNLSVALHLIDEGMESLDRWSESPIDPEVEAGHFREACLRRQAALDALKSVSSLDSLVASAYTRAQYAGQLYGDLLDRILTPIPEGYDGDWDQDLLATLAAFDKTRLGLETWKKERDPYTDSSIRHHIESVTHRIKGCEDVLSVDEHRRKKNLWKTRAAVRARQAEDAAARRAAAAAERQRQARAALPADYEAVAAWHRDRYAPRLVPLKKALGRLLMVDRDRRSPALNTVCGEIFSVTEALMADRQLLSGTAPIDQSVAAMLKAFKAASESCLSGDLKAFTATYQQGEQGLQSIAAALAPYKLVP